MQVVIEVSEEDYKIFMQSEDDEGGNPLRWAVRNGIKLPKGHGRLIDANSIYQVVRPIESSDSEWGMTAETAKQMIHDVFDRAPTILEADKEE